MMLTASVSNAIDPQLVMAFDCGGEGSLPHPSVSELLELSNVFPAMRLRAVAVRDRHHVVALAICCVEVVRVHGISLKAYRMFGGGMHDYTRMYANDAAALDALLKAIRQDARACCTDAICLDNVLVTTETDALPCRYSTAQDTALFIATQDPKGWDGLCGRKSVRRHWNKAKNLVGFRVDHIDGALSQELLEKIAALHRERWQFEGLQSPFERPERIAEYLVHPANKVLTLAWLGEEIMCLHYGMRFRDTLLWHTPLINVKYLDYSPLEVLLAATAQHAQYLNIATFDFGLGGEHYKSRFGNAARTSYNLLLPLRVKGLIAHVVRRSGLAPTARRLISSLRSEASQMRARLRARRASIVCFEFEARDDGFALPPGVKFQLIDSFPDFIDFCRAKNIQPRRYQYERFRSGSTFAAIHDGSSALSYGWLTRKDVFFVSEIQRTIPIGGMCLIYDTFTPPPYRRKGYYTMLLRALARSLQGERVAIFADSTNNASLDAIRRVGFRESGTYRG